MEMIVGPGIPSGCCMTCGGGGGGGISLLFGFTLNGTVLVLSKMGGGAESVVAVEAAEAPPSVVELLVVSDKSLYFRSSLPASSEGLDDVEDAHASLIIDPLVRTPNRTGLANFMEALGRHSTRGASVAAPEVSLCSAPYTEDPNFDRELTQSCTCKQVCKLVNLEFKSNCCYPYIQ